MKLSVARLARWQKRNQRSNTSPRIANICISMVRNEQDIIEPFIRHNIRFFDLMFVLDNRSIDKTRKILRACMKEFSGLIVSDIPHESYSQSDFMTKTMEKVQAGCFADFIAFLDADEFIDAPDRDTFDKSIARIPVGHYGTLTWKTILPDPHMPDDQDCIARARWQRITENPPYVKGIIRHGGRLSSDIVVKQGNHGFRTTRKRKIGSKIRLDDIDLLHFPIRSSNQILAKGVNGWKAHLRQDKPTKNGAYQWRRINDLYENGQHNFDTQTLADEAMVYAQEKTPKTWSDNASPWEGEITSERKYSVGTSAPLSLLIENDPEPIGATIYNPMERKAESDATSSIDNAFDDQWHWDHFFLDIPPFQFILDKYDVKSCLDVGCGTGVLLDFMSFSGVEEVFGIDGINSDSTVLRPEQYAREDIEQELDVGRKYDLVMCLEVVEHVKPDSTDIVIKNIDRHASDLIIFSMAEPGQPGNGHINCLTISEVLDKWAEHGWYPILSDTLAVRALSSLSWFRRNLVVLKRSGDPSSKTADQVLREIGKLGYLWWGQKGGIRRVPFIGEDIPNGKGYQ